VVALHREAKDTAGPPLEPIERVRIRPVLGGDGAVVVYLRLLHASANAADGLDVVPERALRPGSPSAVCERGMCVPRTYTL